MDTTKQAEQDAKDHEMRNTQRLENKKRAIEERRNELKNLQHALQDIVFDFNGLESNIPINHGYWDMLNRFKSLNKEDDAEFLRGLESRR